MRADLRLKKLQLGHMFLILLLLNIFQEIFDLFCHPVDSCVHLLHLQIVCVYRIEVKITFPHFPDVHEDPCNGSVTDAENLKARYKRTPTAKQSRSPMIKSRSLTFCIKPASTSVRFMDSE